MARNSDTQVARKRESDGDLVPVKLPRWMRRKALQISAETGETLGKVFERLAGSALDRDHAQKVGAPAKAAKGAH